MTMRTTPRRAAASASFHIVSGALAIVFLFPLVWAVINSVKTPAEANQAPPTLIPKSFSLELRDLDELRRGSADLLLEQRRGFGTDGRGHGGRLRAGRLRLRTIRLLRQEAPVHRRGGDPDGAVRDDPAAALHPAREARPAELARRAQSRAGDVPAAVRHADDAQLLRVRPA